MPRTDRTKTSKKWRTFTSFNKNGCYTVLPDIPGFDEDGLWRYKGIFFSRHGNLKQTLIAVVNHSPAGLTSAEAGALVGASVRSFLAQSHNIQPLCREKIAGRFVYFSQDAGFFSNKNKSAKRRIHALSFCDCPQILKPLSFWLNASNVRN